MSNSDVGKNDNNAIKKLNKIFESNFYTKYQQYEGMELTVEQIRNIKKLYEKYPEFTYEILNKDLIKLDLVSLADDFFNNHPEYKEKIAMADIFLVKNFLFRYPFLTYEKPWRVSDIENITNEGYQNETEINKFYGTYPEYKGEYLNQDTREKIERFIGNYPNLKGAKWSIEAIDKFDEIESKYKGYVNKFYDTYPEYKGDYLKRGNILTLEEMGKLEDFYKANSDKELRGHKFDIKAIEALNKLEPKAKRKRLEFYKKYPIYGAGYINEVHMDHIMNMPVAVLKLDNKQKSSLLNSMITDKVATFISRLKLKFTVNKKFKKKEEKDIHMDNIIYKGISLKVYEKYPAYKDMVLNKKQRENIEKYYENNSNEEAFFSIKAIDRLNKGTYNQYRGYATYKENYKNGYNIVDSLNVPQQGEKFYRDNPEYKDMPLLVNELENAIRFINKYPELKSVVWSPEEMDKILKLSYDEQIKVHDFYTKNPDYKQKGKLLLIKDIDKINKIYETYPEQKGKILTPNQVRSLYRRRRWRNLLNECNKLLNYKKIAEKEFINKFSEEYPQYDVNKLTKIEIQELDTFHKKYPIYKNDTIQLKDLTRLNNFFNANPQYKNSGLKVEDVWIADAFCRTYKELLGGKRWDVNSMEKFINEGIERSDKIKLDESINKFYRENPEYKGVYLNKEGREKVNKFFIEYPNLKDKNNMKAWSIEVIEKINKEIKSHDKRYVNEFYKNNLEYKGQYLEIKDMDTINTFFKDNPKIKHSNWELKEIEEFNDASEREKQRILDIYNKKPDFTGVYLSDANKEHLEGHMDNIQKVKFKRTKNRGKEM